MIRISALAGGVAWCGLAIMISSALAEEPSANSAAEEGYSIVSTPAPEPTSPYGLRPTYRPSRSKTQAQIPELGDDTAANIEEEPKDEAEQELDAVFGQ